MKEAEPASNRIATLLLTSALEMIDNAEDRDKFYGLVFNALMREGLLNEGQEHLVRIQRTVLPSI